MREGVAKKRGIMTKNSVIASSTIHLDRQLKDLPSSMYIEQPFHIIPEYCVRIPQNEKCISPYDFDSYQNNEILTKTYVSKPLKLDPMYK